MSSKDNPSGRRGSMSRAPSHPPLTTTYSKGEKGVGKKSKNPTDPAVPVYGSDQSRRALRNKAVTQQLYVANRSSVIPRFNASGRGQTGGLSDDADDPGVPQPLVPQANWASKGCRPPAISPESSLPKGHKGDEKRGRVGKPSRRVRPKLLVKTEPELSDYTTEGETSEESEGGTQQKPNVTLGTHLIFSQT